MLEKSPFAVAVSLALLSFASAAGATPAWRPILVEPLLIPRSGDFSVTLGVRGERSNVESGLLGFVTLAVPLERFAAPKRLASNAGGAADEAPPASETSDARATVSKALEPSGGAPLLSSVVLSRLARDTLGAAFRAQAVAVERSQLDGLATRARAAAALPELRFRVLRSNDQSLRLAPTLEDPEHYTLDGGDNLVLEASATWRLNRLVFADDEIAVARLELEHARTVERIRARVLERLFDWHRAASAARDAEPDERAKLELERIEAEVELDVLTGGWFSEMARRLRKSD